MTEPLVTCPHCRTSIKLTESLAAPLIESTRLEFARQLAEERVKICAEESRKARALLTTELDTRAREVSSLQQILKSRDEKLAEAQKVQLVFLQKQRALDDQRRELDLTIEKRVGDGLHAARVQARIEAEEKLRLKVVEKEQTIAAMQRQIEELRRKAEQGSQQLQGEAQEVELETLLRARFPFDLIDPVRKGEHGGDILQHVRNPHGGSTGVILWETKRTKNWSDAWLVKLREDQRVAHAEIAVLVSQALPKDIESFELLDGVWVTHPKTMLPVAFSLRHLLLETAAVRHTTENLQTKAEMVYQYLTGPRFRQRVQAIVEAFTGMQDDLDKERRVISKQWAKRQEQIERVMQATVGMYGDLQGIAGKTIGEIEGLELESLPRIA